MRRRNGDKVIREYVVGLMPKRLRKLVVAAFTDLHSGPHSRSDHRALGFSGWPGYTTAIERIQSWIDEEMPRELWLDTQTDDVQTSEPEGYADDTGEYIEPMLEDYVHFEASAIKRAVFGALVGNGID